MSVSTIEVKTLKIPNTTHLYDVYTDAFQLTKGIILLDILHMVNHEMPQHLNIPILNANNVLCSIGKNMPIASMHSAGNCEEAQEVSWSKVQCDTSKLPPQIPENTSLQLEPGTKSLASSIPDADIPKEARMKLQELLNKKYLQIILQNAMDISRTNLIKLDIPTDGPPIASKLYTVLLKYPEFLDHEIKHLEEADIISWSMSSWTSPILVVPEKQDHMETSNSQSSNNFSLQLCIDCRKLNSCIQTAH